MGRLVGIVWLTACGGQGSTSLRPSCPAPLSAQLRRPSTGVRYAEQLQVELERPAALALAIDGVPVARFPSAERHDVPVLGLAPGSAHDVEVTVHCPYLEPLQLTLRSEAQAWPEPWPDATVYANQTDLREPGVTLLDLQSGDVAYLAVVDEQGVPLWLLDTTTRVTDARLTPEGEVWMVFVGRVERVDLLGRPLDRWEVPGLLMNHEAFPVDGGFLTLDKESVQVSAVPVSIDDPEGPTAPDVVVDPVVVDVALAGTVRQRWSMVERLDPRRVGWLALQQDPEGLDWGHANAVVVDPSDGGVVVSLRHQDAVVKLDGDTGDVRWILSTPEGWREPWSELRLRGEGSILWPTAQHAPMITDDGELLLFDNGNFHRTTPYAPPDEALAGEPLYSRMVLFRIDESAHTVRQVWSHDQTSTGRLFSAAFGDADLLPRTQNRLAVYGWVASEGGERNVDLGRGALSVRVLEVTRDGEIAWELGWTSRRSDRPQGWQTHRAQRLPSLYPPSVAL